MPPRIGTLVGQSNGVADPWMIWLESARYQVPGCDPAARTVRTPENGGPALPNSAARTANFILNL